MPKKKVLVAEDSPTMRMYICFALKSVPGIQVVEVGDGVDAMKKLNEGGIELAVLDINMPLLSGFEVLKNMKKDPELNKIPVVMCTTEEESREKGKELGADEYLSKPVQPTALYKVVEKLLGIKAG